MAGGRAVAGRQRVKRVLRSARTTLYAKPLQKLYETGRLPVDRLTLPDFLGIGAAKAGTTWLHHNLNAHPALYLPPVKELHYWTSRMDLGLHWYAKQFAAAGDRMAGEITPGYSALRRDRIEQIHAVIPDAKLILLVRNPVDRAWSHAVMKLSRETGRPAEAVTERQFIEHFESEFSRNRGDYMRSITNWTSVYPSERLYLGSFHVLSTQPQRLLAEVFEHLGVDAHVDWSTFPCNQVIDRGLRGQPDVFGTSATPPIREDLRDLLVDMYRSEIDGVARAYPELAKTWR